MSSKCAATEIVESKINERQWTDNMERVLDQLRINCAQLSNYHKYKYIYYKNQVKWFKIPIIFLSGVNTFISVGMQEHLEQRYISIITSVVSLFCGIITGIEMFMKFQDKMVIELNTHRDYYKISVEIYKLISIERTSREVSGTTFLDAKFGEYEKIKSRSYPEQHFDLVYDTLADEEELIIYKRDNTKRHKKGWVNKLELAPPLTDKDQRSYDYLSFGYDKRTHPLKYLLREKTKKMEGKRRMSQKYLDLKWLDKNKENGNQDKSINKEKLNEEKINEEKKNETMQDSPVPKYFYSETEKKDLTRLDKMNLLNYNRERSSEEDEEDEEDQEEQDGSSCENKNKEIKINVNDELKNELNNEFECDSDYNASENNNNFSIMNFFRRRSQEMYCHSDDEENY